MHLFDQALIHATTEDVPARTPLAVVDNVMVANLLDGNIRIAKDIKMTEANVYLAALIGKAPP